jgi:hypothetical protein
MTRVTNEWRSKRTRANQNIWYLLNFTDDLFNEFENSKDDENMFVLLKKSEKKISHSQHQVV